MSMEMNKAMELLRGLVSEIERQTCEHAETHRGGAIWEICDSCGAKWADDEGGKPEFEWPESVEKAREFLAAHPTVEQAGGDERAAFELFVRKHCGMPEHIAVNWDAKFTNDAWEGWKARAALAKPSPAQAEQAEAERPEVVARVVHPNPVVLDQCAPLNANDEMMTVAQHAASVARWAEMFNRVEQERDAALARVAELDKQCRDDVARALGLRPSQERGFAWSYLLASIKSCVKASEDAAQAQHSVPAYVSYTTRPAESLAGIALRQLKEESRWVEIRDINAPAFPDMQSHSYYPAGTVIKLPAAAPGKEVGHE